MILEKSQLELKSIMEKLLKKNNPGSMLKVPKTAQQTIPFDFITDDGIICYEETNYSCAYRIGNINYSMSKEEEQEAIYQHYCKFLNMMDCDFQVYLTNDILNSAEFVDRLPDTHPTHKIDLEYYSNWMGNIAEKKHASDRHRYLILKLNAKKYEEAVSEKERKLTQISNHFKVYNTSIVPLDREEYLKLFYDYFNHSHKHLYPFNTSQVDMDILKGATIKDIIAPSSIKFTSKHIECGEDFKRTLFIMVLPNVLSDKFLNDLLMLPFPIDISIHYSPSEKGDSITYINRRITGMEASKIGYEEKKRLVPTELKRSIDAAYKLQSEILDKDQSLFGLAVYIGLTAESLEELDEMTTSVISKCRAHSVRAFTATHRQERGMIGLLPLCNNKMNIRRGVLTNDGGIFIPFTTQDAFSPSGIFYGINELSRSLIVIDRKTDIKNPSGFRLGGPGSGKTMGAKAEMWRVFLTTDDDIIIIDPENEYGSLVNKMGGEFIEISSSSSHYLNPFDMAEFYGDDEPPLKLKSEFLLGLFERFLGKLEPIEKSILDRVIGQSYQKYIVSHFDQKNIPVLSTFFDLLCNQPEQEAKRLAVSLELYVKGSLDIFSQRTNVNLTNRVTCFNINRLGEQLKPTGMSIVMDNLWNRLIDNRAKKKRTWVYIDEIYLLFDNEYQAKFLYYLWKRIRKYGGIPTGITQNIEDLLRSDTPRSMLSNSQFIVLMDQAQNDRDMLAKVLGLSDAQLKYITNAQSGHGLILLGGTVFPCEFTVSDEEYKVMTTRIEEV